MARSSRPASECSAASNRASSDWRPRSCGLLQLLEFGCVVGVPPFALEHHAFREDALLAGHVLAGDVDIVELAVLDGEDGGVAGAARLEGAELGALQGHR